MRPAVRPCYRILGDSALCCSSRARNLSNVAGRGFLEQSPPTARRTPFRTAKRCAAALDVSKRGRRFDNAYRGGMHGRRMASTIAATRFQNEATAAAAEYGPMQEYENRVQSGRLREDDFQRGMLDNYLCPVNSCFSVWCWVLFGPRRIILTGELLLPHSNHSTPSKLA